jgi:pantoate--beta-alanine ligase
MQIIHDPREMQRAALALRSAGRRIAFVPTMGALHEGHMRLVDEAKRLGDFVVVSVFVNPTQFGPKEDFSKYPRTLDADAALCRERGADCVFAPPSDGMYAPDFSTYVNEELCSQGLCGDFRPGHFRGVATVVTMLFNVVQPHVAIFGAKDGQQCAVIRKMVDDLFMPVEIVVAETVREADGLALSSRNRYLSPELRVKAPALYRALLAAKGAVASGEREAGVVRAAFETALSGEPAFRLQYFTLADARTMAPVATVTPGKTLAVVAAYLGETRLIDNLPL